MVNFVTKKDATRVAFNAEKIKISITAAAMEAGLTNEQAAETTEKVLGLVMDSFKNVEEVTTTEISEKVLTELDVVAPQVAESWRKYEESKHA